MHNPFDLGDAVIRDLPHVRVTRHAPQAGRACEYRKVFKAEGLGGAAYWIQRENDFLLDFTVKKLRHTVELAAFAQGGAGRQTPVVELVATRDAGVTVEDWLRVQPRYENGVVWPHPFQHAGLFLQLLRACLVALREIHQLGIVHCDIKEDNICLPYEPCPCAPGQPVRIDFGRVKLIDFAFSVCPDRPLEHPLPILPAAPYQSNLLKEALGVDRSGRRRGRLAAQQLDYRVDLYSLGYLAERILDAGLLQPAGFGGAAAMDGARNLVERLQAFGGGRRRPGRTLPHGELIADIDGLLGNLADLDAYQRFEISRLRETAALGSAPAGGGVGPTPLTPLASPLAAPGGEQARPAGRFPWLAAATLLAGLGLAGYWQASRKPAPPPAEAKPKAAAESEAKKQRARQEAKWKADAEAQFQAEEAKAREEARRKAESEARARAELAQEIKAEAERQAAAKPAGQAPAGKAAASIDAPADGGTVERSATVSGSLEGLADSQTAFLIVRSKAFGRLYYPQAELPRRAEWSARAVYATPDYEYETFVVATDNPNSAYALRDPQSRAYGLKSLPGDVRVISGIVTVKRRP